MIFLFVFEFVEGNTITRLYFMKLRKITSNALEAGVITTELEKERSKLVPSFTHYFDLPMLFLIIALAVQNWGSISVRNERSQLLSIRLNALA